MNQNKPNGLYVCCVVELKSSQNAFDFNNEDYNGFVRAFYILIHFPVILPPANQQREMSTKFKVLRQT